MSIIGVREHRKFNRIFFSAKEKIIGTFNCPKLNHELLSAYIMNMSIGGLGITYEKSENIIFKQGERLILERIEGIPLLESINNIEVEIKWVLNHKEMKHVGFGCEFQNIPQAIKNHFQNFIDFWVKKTT